MDAAAQATRALKNAKELELEIKQKLATASRIYSQRGLSGVWHTIRQKFIALGCTDENEIIFESLKDSSPKGIMCDVGAHHGFSLIPFARENWQVFAFEPDPDNRSKLLEITKPFPGIQVDERAVSDQVKTATPFYTSRESNGVSSLSAFLPTHELALMVDTTTLSHFFSDQNIQHVDYLKIDTEGFDLFVLQGVDWAQVKPKVVMCEFDDFKTQKLGYTYQTLADFLVGKGYHVIVSEWHPIVRYGEQHSWRGYYAYPHNLHVDKAWGNLIATNDDEVYHRLLKKCKIKV